MRSNKSSEYIMRLVSSYKEYIKGDKRAMDRKEMPLDYPWNTIGGLGDDKYPYINITRMLM